MNELKLRKMIKKIFVLLMILIFYTLPATPHAEDTCEVTVSGSIFSGTSILHIQGKSFDAKMVPVVGISVSSHFIPNRWLFFGAELAFMYSFKSNYNNYYYYDSYYSLSLLPHFGIHFQSPSLAYVVLAGLGGSVSFSNYLTRNYLIASVGAGIFFKKFFIDGILLSYSHSFFKDFKVFETVKVHAIIHFWEQSKSSSNRR